MHTCVAERVHTLQCVNVWTHVCVDECVHTLHTVWAAEAQRGRDPKGGRCPLAWAGQPWASGSLCPCLINEGGVGPFSLTCPSPARPCLLSRWTPPSHFLPPRPDGPLSQHLVGVSSEPRREAGSRGGRLRNSVGVAPGL